MEKLNKNAKTSFILGIISLFAWILPIAGFPVSIVGLLMGKGSLQSEEAKKAKEGMILSIVGLSLSAINSLSGIILFIVDLVATI